MSWRKSTAARSPPFDRHPLRMAEYRVGLIRLRQCLQLFGGKLDLQCPDRVVEVPHLACADDGCGNALLVEDPRERQLRIRDTPLLSYRAQPVDHCEVGR